MNDIEAYEKELSARLLPSQYIRLAQLMVERIYKMGMREAEQEIRIMSEIGKDRKDWG